MHAMASARMVYRRPKRLRKGPDAEASGLFGAIVDACRAAWNQLIPEWLRSLTNSPYLQPATCRAGRHKNA
jgi:hypothetical protein